MAASDEHSPDMVCSSVEADRGSAFAFPFRAGRGFRVAVILVSLLALDACSGATPTPAAAKSSTGARAPAAPPPSLAPGRLARADVDKVVLSNGPPWILERVPIEEVIHDGKFVGWRVMAMPEPWSAVDLKPGDVVTRVNGVFIERPEDLFMVWTSLVVASDLRIAYERGGAAREVAFHIEGEPAKEIPASLQSDAPPPPRPRGGSLKKGTVIIVDDAGSADDNSD